MLPLRPLGKNRPMPFVAPPVTMDTTCAGDRLKTMELLSTGTCAEDV